MKQHLVVFGFAATAALTAICIISPLVGLAQTNPPGPTTYAPIAPINGVSAPGVTAATYLPGIFKLGIGIASGLAVLSIAYGGIQYMMSDVVTSKSAAVGHIKNALLGLSLAIASYLILFTINPDFVKLNFTAPAANTGGVSGPYTLVWSAPPQYEFKYQLSDYRLTYVSKTDGLSYFDGFASPTDCQNAASTMSDVDQTRGTLCVQINAYVATYNGSTYVSGYQYGTPYRDTSLYPLQDPKDTKYTTLLACQQYAQPTLNAAADRPYKFNILINCQPTATGSAVQQTKTFSTLGDCQQFIQTSAIPSQNIYINCSPYQ